MSRDRNAVCSWRNPDIDAPSIDQAPSDDFYSGVMKVQVHCSNSLHAFAPYNAQQCTSQGNTFRVSVPGRVSIWRAWLLSGYLRDSTEVSFAAL
jgi:hypothetical protein